MKSSGKEIINRLITVIATGFMFLSMNSCGFFQSFTEDSENKEEEKKSIEIDSLSLAKSTLSMKVGSMDYMAISVRPQKEQKNITMNWSYDDSIIKCDTSSNWGVTITALKEGQTSLKCSYGGFDAVCLITVSGYETGFEKVVEPYIYSNTTILQTRPGVSERIYVSLYGGDVSDLDGYTWTVEKSSVAEIQPTGQYCLIKAKDSGYTRIKVTHQKAQYPYYIGVYVFTDPTNVTYITTPNNIITMNTDDSSLNISVSLVNGKNTSTDSSFSWEIVTDKAAGSNETPKNPIKLDFNGNNAVVTPVQSGSCTIRITHPDAIYPLDILCRVVTVVKNVYIQPDSTVVVMNGEEQKTITSTLANIKEGEYSIGEYTYSLDCTEENQVCEIVNSVANQVSVKGVKNGSCKLLIQHPKAAYNREVLLIVQGIVSYEDATDASCYITTTQNYIKTKVGENSIPLSVSLKGGEDGDETSFVWTVKNEPKEADSTDDVILLETTNGTIEKAESRAALWNYSEGKAYITPKSEGTAVITVSHPKVYYPTEILVKVLDKDAILTEPLYFSGSGLIKVLNGETTEYKVELKGKNKENGDENNIVWKAEDNRVKITSNGNLANIQAPELGTGSTISFINISHSKCDADKKVLLMTADDQQTLDTMKALYSDKLYYNIEVGDSAVCMASDVGFDGTYDEENDIYTSYDFSSAKWTVKNPAICSVERTEGNPLFAIVRGLKAGTTTVSVSLEDAVCEFTITVYPAGTVSTEPEVYFTTSQNVISITEKGKETTAYVNAINLSSREYSNIVWSSDNDAVASVIGNGTNATITANDEGTAVLSVSHPDSQNTLKIYVRVGSEYVFPGSGGGNGSGSSGTQGGNGSVIYIQASDVITMCTGDKSQQLQAFLVNHTDQKASGFTFAVDNENIAKIEGQSTNGVAFISPVQAGQAEITISHTATSITKKVLVVVGNSEEELLGMKYLTTSKNVIAIGEGNTKSVSVNVKNSEEIVVDGYSWSSSNPAIVDVTGNGSTAVLKGNCIGTAIITVYNTGCKYPLSIIAQVVDPIAANEHPYIQLTSSVLTLTVGNQYTNITADLVGGNESDNADFNWKAVDPSVVTVFGQNEVGKIKALKEGTTYITVSHPKADFDAQVLVVCDKKSDSNCYISVPSSILNLKPTDASQTITANLINGTNEDKYNFKWETDVFDIVDMNYSGNVCVIKPLAVGKCTITVHHDKAAYDQKINVTVQEYSEFGFPKTNMTIYEGEVAYITMQVPYTNLKTYIRPTSSNQSVCTVQGTSNGSVIQITGVNEGTTTIKAELIADSMINSATNSTGVQSTSEMFINVKKREIDSVYITATSTLYTVKKGKSLSLSANLVGKTVTNDDLNSLEWSTSDSDIISITGLTSDGTVKGSSVYITAKDSGEAVVTCKHAKANSDLQFYVIVPGTGEKTISLDKSFITIKRNSSGTTLKATIQNSDGSSDYNNIVWNITSEDGNDTEIARIMGNGQTVTIFPVKAGLATITASLGNNSENVAKCTVRVEEPASFTFESKTKSLKPFETIEVKYKVNPPDSVLTWTDAQANNIFTYAASQPDANGEGTVTITGIKEGTGVINCVSNNNSKGSITIKVSWDYSFVLDGNYARSITGTPDKKYVIPYSVNPPDSDIFVDTTDCEDIVEYELFEETKEVTEKDDDGKDVKKTVKLGNGTITVNPKLEGTGNILIRAKNPNDGNHLIEEKTLKVRFEYTSLTPKLELVESVAIKDGKKAYFSKISSDNVLHIGDGEKVKLKLTFNEKNVDIKNIELNLGDCPLEPSGHSLDSNDCFTIKSIPEVTESVYKIVDGYKPVYNGNSNIKISNFIKEIDCSGVKEKSNCWNAWDFWVYITYSINNRAIYKIRWNDNELYQRVNGSTHSKTIIFEAKNMDIGDGWSFIRDKSMDGTYMGRDVFENNYLYYLPEFSNSWNKGGGFTCRHDVSEIIINRFTPTTFAVLLENSDDVSEIGVKDCILSINVEHGLKKIEKLSYSIKIETRNCLCTFDPNAPLPDYHVYSGDEK